MDVLVAQRRVRNERCPDPELVYSLPNIIYLSLLRLSVGYEAFNGDGISFSAPLLLHLPEPCLHPPIDS